MELEGYPARFRTRSWQILGCYEVLQKGSAITSKQERHRVSLPMPPASDDPIFDLSVVGVVGHSITVLEIPLIPCKYAYQLMMSHP